jgi:hypothetical protein
MPQKTNQEKKAEWDKLKEDNVKKVINAFVDMVNKIPISIHRAGDYWKEQAEKWRSEALRLQQKLNSINYVEEKDAGYGKDIPLPKDIGMYPYKEQPIGLSPWNIVLENHKKARLQEIEKAIVRYFNASIPIPNDWIAERNNLIQELGENLDNDCEATDFMP